MQPSWGQYIANQCSFTSHWSFQEQKWCIPQTNKSITYDISYFGRNFSQTMRQTPLPSTMGPVDHNILLFYFIRKRTLPEALNSAVLTQQWKCHPVRQEHHFLQHLRFLWRSPKKCWIYQCSEQVCFSSQNWNIYFIEDQMTGYYQKKKQYQYDNEQMLLNSSSFYRKKNVSFYFHSTIIAYPSVKMPKPVCFSKMVNYNRD